jgi:hypothetical protein
LTGSSTSAPGSFLFSLRNNDDLAPFKAPLRFENTRAGIYRFSRFGPAFGHSDLVIANNAGSTTGTYTRFGGSYQPPPGYTGRETNTKSLLAGSYFFNPSEVEVFY